MFETLKFALNVIICHPNLFLVLRLHPFDCQRPATGGALLGSRYMDLFVYMIRDGSLVMRTMGGAGLTSRTLGLTVRSSARERSGLASRGTLGGFQLLAQPLIFFLELLIFFLQPLILSACLVTFLPRTTQLLHQFSDAADRIEGLEKQIIL